MNDLDSPARTPCTWCKTPLIYVANADASGPPLIGYESSWSGDESRAQIDARTPTRYVHTPARCRDILARMVPLTDEDVPLEWMQTISGRRVYPARLRVEDIYIEDVAHALAYTCRFAGHIKRFYSVAQHSVLVAQYVMARKRPLSEARWALLHDASEAYLGDITWPLKQHPAMRGYKELERDAMAVIARHFRLEGDEPAIVKEADLAILATEKRDLLNVGPSHDDKAVREVAAARKTHDAWHCDHVEPNVLPIIPMLPEQARDAFLALFHRELFPGFEALFPGSTQ